MKRLATIVALATTLIASANAQIRRPTAAGDDDGVYSRTVIHPDETRTVSKQDINNKIREKRTLDKNGILLMKSIFQLNASGKPVNGLVYDGRNRLLYRSEFSYDNASRLQEERVFDAAGNPVRRLIYKKDRFGQIKPFALSFADGRTTQGSSTNNLERYSTVDPHAYRGGTGVENTLSAYRPTSPTPLPKAKRTKRERRFRIFRGR